MWHFVKTNNILKRPRHKTCLIAAHIRMYPGYCIFTAVMLIVSPTDSAVPGQVTLSYNVREESLGYVITSIPQDVHLQKTQSMTIEILSVTPASVTTQLSFHGTDLTMTSQIDREALCNKQPICDILIEAVLLENYELRTQLLIKISLLDINDNDPYFVEGSPYRVVLPQNVKSGHKVDLPQAFDNDLKPNGVTSYRINGENTNSFRVLQRGVDGNVPVLSVVSPSGITAGQTFRVSLIAADGGTPSREAELQLEISIQKINEQSPVFVQSSLQLTAYENTGPGSPIGNIVASDNDEGLNGQVNYFFEDFNVNTKDNLFTVNPSNGQIQVKHELDYESSKEYSYKVIAQDLGNPPKITEGTLRVRVLDVNDGEPQIDFQSPKLNSSKWHISVDENLPNNSFLGFVKVSDSDSGENGKVKCHLVATTTAFSLVERSKGVYQLIVGNPVLDFEVQTEFQVDIVCADNGIPALQSSGRVLISVKDLNDNIPKFKQDQYTIEVQENDDRKMPVLKVDASDEDSGANGRILFKLQDKATPYFRLDPNSGLLTTSGHPFDFELLPTFTFYIYAEDNGDPVKKSQATVIVTIGDENDEAAQFILPYFTKHVRENEPPGTAVGPITAVDRDSSPYNSFVYGIVEASDEALLFKIDPNTGMLSTTRPLDREAKATYYLKVYSRNTNPPFQIARTDVAVFVNDTNDNDPFVEFPPSKNFSIRLPSTLMIGNGLTGVKARDDDEGVNSQLEYFIIDSDNPHMFAIDKHTGIISKRDRSTDVKIGDVFHLTVQVKDGGTPPRYAHTSITFEITLEKDLHLFMAFTTTQPTTVAAASNTKGASTNQLLFMLIGSGVILIVVTIGIFIAVCLCVRKNSSSSRSNFSKTSEDLSHHYDTMDTFKNNTMQSGLMYGQPEGEIKWDNRTVCKSRQTSEDLLEDDRYSLNSALSTHDINKAVGAEAIPMLATKRPKSKEYKPPARRVSDDLNIMRQPRPTVSTHEWPDTEHSEDPDDDPFVEESETPDVPRRISDRLRTFSTGNPDQTAHPTTPSGRGDTYVKFVFDDVPTGQTIEHQDPYYTGQHLYNSLERVRPSAGEQAHRRLEKDSQTLPIRRVEAGRGAGLKLSNVSEDTCYSGASVDSYTPALNEDTLKFLQMSQNGQWDARNSGVRPPSYLKPRLREGTTKRAEDSSYSEHQESDDSKEKHGNGRNSQTPDLLEHAQIALDTSNALGGSDKSLQKTQK